MTEFTDRNPEIGEFQQGVQELSRSSHAIAEALDEFRSYEDDELGELAKLHYRQGLTALELAGSRLEDAKKKLNSYHRKEVDLPV
jgi:hypothetical protein